MRKGITIITWLVLSMLWQLAVSAQASTKQNYQAIYQPMLDELVSEYIPGAVLYVESQQGYFLGSAGFQDLEKNLPMITEVVIPNGSAGKKLTALLVAMLNQQGILELDAPISRYLDKKLLTQIQHSDKMTLRQLLNHTSGIIEYNDVGDYAFFKAQYAKQKEVTSDEFPLSFALNQEADFKPAERFSYSNTGYALTGVILESVLKAHPASAIRNQILTPLGMTSSYSKGVETHQPDLASGFFINDEDPDFPTPMNTWIDMKQIIGTTATSDAPLASNVVDMAKLLRAIVRSNKVVSERVREQMIGEQHLVAASGPRFYRGSKFRYGLGVWVEEIAGNTFYHHGGTEFGYYTQNIYIPKGDVSITAFVNCGVNARCESAFQDFTFEVVDSFLHIIPITLNK
ncbi:serine hydrolase domain-containing protein [Pseudoalteromonas sp. S16_S37]|uniref:serine hydrolase domain-containing protein n=1 Tax=Pseudoalteromonas sp. S16_S37 TaxID=2720228 RepID=UPI001680E679|nr:serine hydrolase domain-containing protein [Pseudoalteromonas sp. S16_S37]MBD1584648.1 beta-lactamase family protein [Pseudoalteromonas sp. S16_S37]